MTRLRRLVAPALTRCVERPGHRDASTRAPEDGFTLIEVIVAFTLAAIVFTALAIAMAGGMKAVRVAKDRTRGNELATAAIEDLQRFDYDHLGLCPSSGSGVTDPGTQSFQGLTPVTLNCATGTLLEEPCTPTIGQVPKASYTCTVDRIGYTVGAGSEYLVVSELRGGDGKANATIYPPAITFCGANCGSSSLPSITGTAPSSVDIDPGGLLNVDVAVSAQTTGIAATDSVFVTFATQAGAVTIA